MNHRALRGLVLAVALAVVIAGCHRNDGGDKKKGGGGGGPPPPPPKPLVPPDVLALHDQDLAAAGLTCQAADCHPDQMERYAPRTAAGGKKIENFHYMKAAALSGTFFGGRKPENFRDQDCAVCHKRVKLLAASGADAAGAGLHLRRMVDVSFCAGCHGPGGPGKPLYLK